MKLDTARTGGCSMESRSACEVGKKGQKLGIFEKGDGSSNEPAQGRGKKV